MDGDLLPASKLPLQMPHLNRVVSLVRATAAFATILWKSVFCSIATKPIASFVPGKGGGCPMLGISSFHKPCTVLMYNSRLELPNGR